MWGRVLVGALAAAGVVGSLPNAPGATASSPSASDTAIVDAALLTIDDFPPGWRETRSSSSSTTPDLSDYGKTCARLQATANQLKKKRAAHGRSSDFKHGEFDQVSDSAGVFPTVAATGAAMAFFRSPGLPRCFEKAVAALVKKSAPEGSEVRSSVGRLSVPQVGDDTVGFEIELRVRQHGLTITVYIDMQLVQVARTGLTFSFEGEDPAPGATYQSMVETVVDRVRTADATS